MEIEIVHTEEKYFDSFADTLDAVARERRFLSMLQGPPKDQVSEFIRRFLAKGDVQFYAVRDGQVIGWCDVLSKSQQPAFAHIGVLGMGLLPGYRGMGLGSRLMRATLEACDAKPFERVELLVFDRNENAKALYLKHGFKVEARMERFVKLEGIFRSALLMSRLR